MVTKILRRAKLPSFANEGSSLDPVPSLAARGRSRKDGFPIVGAVCDRPYFVNSRKNARSQTAPTIDTANSTGFCHGLLVDEFMNYMESKRSPRYVQLVRQFTQKCHIFRRADAQHCMKEHGPIATAGETECN